MAVVVATGIAADGSPGGPRPRRRRQRGRDVLARLPDRPQAAAAWPACGWSSPTSTPAWSSRAEALLPGRRAPALPGPLRPQPARPRAQVAQPTWSPRCSAPSSPNPTPPPSRTTWDEVRDQLAESFPKIGPLMDDAKAEVLAFTAFPERTGTRSGRPTRSSGSTRRSNAAPASSGSSPTTPPSSASSAPSWPTCTTNGKPATAATSPKLHGAALPRPRY